MRVENARLHWQDDGLPYSEQFDDVYFSRQGALQESRHVFLQANALWQRWQDCIADSPDTSRVFVVAELGFGCALNFLQTLMLWRRFNQESENRLRLQYLGFEKYPPTHSDLTRIFSLWPELAEPARQLLQHYPDHSAGCHRLSFGDDCVLDLYFGDALDSLKSLAGHGLARADAWYVDGFSPSRNPAMWQDELFSLVARCSRQGASLSSYSVAGSVRRALSAAGFEVSKAPGYGNKRHMLRARLVSPGKRQAHPQPWFILPEAEATAPGDITIVGAGLAGCSLAYSLSRRACQVRILEAGPCPMAGASGSGQLALRCRLVAEDNPTARFYLQAFLFAARQFASLADHSSFWHPCGVLQLDEAMADRRQRHGDELQRKLLSLYAAQVIQDCPAGQTSELAGLALKEGGLWFPAGGWIDPAGLAGAYLARDAIDLRLNSPVASIAYEQGAWLTRDASGTVLSKSQVLVICASAGIEAWPVCADLPLERVRGQITFLDSTVSSAGLRTVICGARSVFPASGGQHTLAASYDRHDDSLASRVSDDQLNIQTARALFRDEEVLAAEAGGARTAIRSSTPDRLPLLGPLPDLQKMLDDFGALQRDASLSFTTTGSYLPGLYISAGHGSNGLSSCSLGSEYLASLITGECPPLDARAMELVNPVRFLIRDLKRQKQLQLNQR